MPLQIETILCRAGKMDNYSYIITDEQTGTTAILDPSEAAPIITKLEQLKLKPQYIFNTHHHFDHTDDNLTLKEKYGALVVANQQDNARIPGFDIGVENNKTFHLGNSIAQIIDASAHTQGHILWYFPEAKALFTGDTLFNLCIGGLFEGSPQQMFAVLQKIKQLPDDTLFYPGHEYTPHGAHDAFVFNNRNQDIQNYLAKAKANLEQGLPAGPFTLAEEKRCNPYLQAQSLSDFKKLF
ncbi:MAG: hydroxyacylglutathione hydrolase [Alphaproteobacteria bacterium]|nr:hydroxyacylglutathione hydrolase [Alphaproteobacteria bacterium]